MELPTYVNERLPLKEIIDNQLKKAMLDKDIRTRDVLRVIKAEISREEAGIKTYGDDEIIKLIQKAIKNLEIVGTDESKEEIVILQKYIPKQMSEAEIEEAIKLLVIETGASGIKDIGKLMGAFNSQYKGRANSKTVSEVVKRVLA